MVFAVSKQGSAAGLPFAVAMWKHVYAGGNEAQFAAVTVAARDTVPTSQLATAHPGSAKVCKPIDRTRAPGESGHVIMTTLDQRPMEPKGTIMSEPTTNERRSGRPIGESDSATNEHPALPAHPHRPIAIMVLGMHRSGTSALTRVLSLLGADLPTAIMPATPWNEAGHWESVDLMELHDSILASAGSTWDDWRKFNRDWRSSPAAGPFQERLLAVLRNDFRNSPLFVVKDPRICRFIPLWLDVLLQLPADPVAVIPLRNPLDVCASLKARDGFLPARSMLLWLRHVLEAEAETRGIRRAVVTYESLMNDWSRTVAAIAQSGGFTWPRRSAEVAIEIERFISPKLHHHNTSVAELVENPEVVEWARTAYAALLQLASNQDVPAALHRLDEVRTAFDQASAAFGIAVAEAELEASEQRAAVAQRDRQIAGLDQAIDAAHTVMHRTQDELARAMAERERIASAYDDLWKDFNEAHKALNERGERIAGLERDLSAARCALRETQADLQRLSGEAASAKEEAAAATAERDWAARVYDDLSKRSARESEFNDRIASYLRGSIKSQAALSAQLRSANGRGAPLTGILNRLFVRNPIGSQAWDWERHAIIRSGLFDSAWYLERYPDVAASGIDPLWHYLSYGGAERRDPSPLFDSDWYASQATDLVETKLTPLGHYVLLGFSEGLDPHPLFDTDWYLTKNPDIPLQQTNPLQHFITTGGAKGLDPHPLFDSSFYCEKYPDIAGENPLRHYLTHGCWEGRSPHPLFDPEWYVQQYSSSEDAGQNPLVHFLKYGVERKRSPHPLFDMSWYLGHDPAAAESGSNPLVDYLSGWEINHPRVSAPDRGLFGSADGPPNFRRGEWRRSAHPPAEIRS